MNKQKLIEELFRLQRKRGISKKAIDEIVQSIFDHMVLTIRKKKKFSYPGFGTFIIRKRKKRIARNPKTGENHAVPGRKTILFRAFQNTKELINPK